MIANNGVSFSALKKELKKKFSITEHTFNRTEPYLFAVLAAKLEDEFIDTNHQHNSKSYSHLIGGYRPKRCCNKCAAEGYHSELFDLPWLIKCPIHNECLTERCNKCNSFWPRAHELISSECKTCGVKISAQELSKSITSDSDEGYKLLVDALSLIQEGYRQFPQDFLLYHHKTREYDIRPLINQHSAFHLSVVENTLHERSILCHLIKTPDIEKKTFKVTQILKPSKADEKSKELQSLKVEIIKKTVKKFENTFNHDGHVIGTCETASFPQRVCLSCATFYAWKMLIKYFDNKYDEYYWLNILVMMYAGVPPSPPIMYSTICLGNNYSHKNYIKLPIKLSGKIYEYDLWTTAMHLYQYLEDIMNRAKDLPMFWTDFTKNSRPIMMPHNSTFSPYVMKLASNNLDVYFFKKILTTRLNENERIDQLLSYSL